MLKLYLTVDKSEQSVILTHANVVAGMDSRSSLTNDDVACYYCLTVSLLYAQTLGLAVTTILSRTYTFFVSKKLQTELQHHSTSINLVATCTVRVGCIKHLGFASEQMKFPYGISPRKDG